MNSICEQLKTIFSAAFGLTIRTYFHGQADIIEMDNLPMLMVYPIRTRVARKGTVRDETEFTIKVEIQISLKQYYDIATGQGTTLDSLAALEALVEDRDTDGDAQSDTVIGILNNNLTIGGKVLYTNNIEADYTTFRVGKTQRAKAVVTFTAYDRPNRI